MEIVGLLLLALLLFGAKRLPEIGRSLGSGMREFKDSVSGEKKVETRSELPPPVPAEPVPVVEEAARVAAEVLAECPDVRVLATSREVLHMPGEARFAVEPLPADNPLWDLPNVIFSPHSASTVAAENGRIVDIFLDNLDRFLDGRPMRNLFEAERGY
jgi:TatA/E family protein of Tat protein translocase